MKLQPLEDFVFEGFSSRFQQVFGCVFVITNEYEKRRTVDRLNGGEQLAYPYAFGKITGTDSTMNSYNPNYFVRRGIETVISHNGEQAYTVRCMPMAFELEIEYHTNSFLGPNSVLHFIKRWNMAARAGYLKFTINYGRLALRVGVTMGPTTSIPEKENIAEQENVYKMISNCTVHGWVSEQMTGSKGIVRRLDSTLVVQGSLTSAQALNLPGLQSEVAKYLEANPKARFTPFTKEKAK
jgi:hypothetical protein